MSKDVSGADIYRRLSKQYENSVYSPDLTLSDYHLFGLLKYASRGRQFATDNELQEAVHKWLRGQPKTFLTEGIRKLVDC